MSERLSDPEPREPVLSKRLHMLAIRNEDCIKRGRPHGCEGVIGLYRFRVASQDLLPLWCDNKWKCTLSPDCCRDGAVRDWIISICDKDGNATRLDRWLFRHELKLAETF